MGEVSGNAVDSRHYVKPIFIVAAYGSSNKNIMYKFGSIYFFAQVYNLVVILTLTL